MNLTNRVLVLGDNDLACLEIARSLGRSGLEVHLVSWYPNAITRCSLYVNKVYDCGHPEREPDDFVHNILRLIESTKFDLVILALDAALVPLLEVADTLRAHSTFVPRSFSCRNSRAPRGRGGGRYGPKS